MSTFIAIDWGTTNRRVYRIENGIAVHSSRDDRGVVAMAGTGYPQALAEIRSRHGDLPVLMAGMVGSSIGWRDAGYCALPAGLATLAASLHRIDDRTAIVPGLSLDGHGRTDVMRGEEAQLLGAVAASMVPMDACLCQPGTHCKWARIVDGELIDFTTAMSGELFAMLRAHSVIGSDMTAPAAPGPAFDRGVTEGARRDLAASLFGVRSAGLLGRLAPADAASYASGLLIGADVAARLEQGERIHVLADPDLGNLYCDAIHQLGGHAERIDSHRAFVAGITAIQEMSS